MITKKRLLILLATAMFVCGTILPRYEGSATSDNEHRIYEYLINSGFNTAAAVGILANIEAESSFNPNATGDYVNGVATSYGICQWHNDRWTNLKNKRPNDWTTLDGQLAFLVQELQESKKTINSYMRNSIPNTADGAYEAGRYWCYNFEVPANRTIVSQNRGNRAKNYYWPKYYVPPVQNAYLDVNGILNGTATGTLLEYGTFDVYINGTLDANDTNDYYKELTAGTRYEIKDIRPTAEHSYSGNGSYSGTIGTSTVNINLTFDTYGTLTVLGRHGTTTVTDMAEYGNFDLYIGDNLIESDRASYSGKWPKGTTYEIRPKETSGYLFAGAASGSLKGTFGNSTNTVTLLFSDLPGGDWSYTDILPTSVNADTCEIQYRYSETRVSASSPGEGWVRQEDSGTTRYEDDGEVYESDFELSTSNTRIYVGSYYYHYCGASTGVNVEHYNDGTHTDYHVAGDVNQFYVSAGPYTDDKDARYVAYAIKWVEGQWADGNATCSAGRSSIWYRRYLYQNKKAVTYYTWVKETDWQAEIDSSLKAAEYRYRLRDSAKPFIISVKVTQITPAGYTIACRASDDSGITKLSASSWTDTETKTSAKVTNAVPEKTDQQVEISITIPIADHGNEKDVNYHTKISVEDKAGNVTDYTDEEITVYIPMLLRSSRVLEFPTGLIEIEDEAFNGSSQFGEVYIPNGVHKIGRKAFGECSRLVLISIPDSVTEIADDAFAGSTNTVILCNTDSFAAAYAKSNGIPYLTCVK